jgi:hypothetical protein
MGMGIAAMPIRYGNGQRLFLEAYLFSDWRFNSSPLLRWLQISRAELPSVHTRLVLTKRVCSEQNSENVQPTYVLPVAVLLM